MVDQVRALVLQLDMVLSWGRKRDELGAVLLGRRLSLRKNVATRTPEQATVQPEAPKAFHVLLSLGPGAVSSVYLLQELCPHPLPHQTLKDGLRATFDLPASCMASCGLCPVPALFRLLPSIQLTISALLGLELRGLPAASPLLEFRNRKNFLSVKFPAPDKQLRCCLISILK